MADLESLYEAILKGKLEIAKAVTTEAIAENVDPHLIINDYMSRGM
ncbi:MAG: B12-binding domain-containing protein, partial [Parabacteroides gordonii]|nr:B12-binding domain-containing protein [Parabacteroides gordonii]